MGIRAVTSLPRKRWLRVLGGIVVVLGLVTYANIALHQRGQSRQATSALLAEMDTLLHEQSDLQWRTLADRNAPVRVAREIGAIRFRVREILASLHGDLPSSTVAHLERQIANFHEVLDQELNLLAVGKTDQALTLEREQTTPQFDELSSRVAALNKRMLDDVRKASSLANTVLILAMLLAAAVTGSLLFRFDRAHHTAIRAGEDLLTQQQLVLQQAAESAELIKYRALHDPLTGLPNRVLFAERVAAAADRLTLLLIDLDDFKAVNDTLGHAAGDDLLKQVAERLHGAIRTEDTAARLGGDEFAVILHQADAALAIPIAERTLATLNQPYLIAGTTVRTTASIGMAVGRGHCDSDQLLHEADVAMYHAKRNGKSSYVIYQDEVAKI